MKRSKRKPSLDATTITAEFAAAYKHWMRLSYELDALAVDYRETGMPEWLGEAMEATQTVRNLVERGYKRLQEAKR